MRPISKRRPAFTFIELMVAALIFTILASAIYLSFNVGIRAWRKGEEGYNMRQQVRYLFATMAREMRCAVNSSSMAFEGEPGSVSFCRASNGLFRVTYTYEPEEAVVKRILRTYSEDASGENGRTSIVASDISDFKLLYAYKNGDKIKWLESWPADNKAMPLGVKVSLAFSPKGTDINLEYLQTIIIPTGIAKEKEGS